MMTSHRRAAPLPVSLPAPGDESRGASSCWEQRSVGGHLLPAAEGPVEKSASFCDLHCTAPACLSVAFMGGKNLFLAHSPRDAKALLLTGSVCPGRDLFGQQGLRGAVCHPPQLTQGWGRGVACVAGGPRWMGASPGQESKRMNPQ